MPPACVARAPRRARLRFVSIGRMSAGAAGHRVRGVHGVHRAPCAAAGGAGVRARRDDARRPRPVRRRAPAKHAMLNGARGHFADPGAMRRQSARASLSAAYGLPRRAQTPWKWPPAVDMAAVAVRWGAEGGRSAAQRVFGAARLAGAERASAAGGRRDDARGTRSKPGMAAPARRHRCGSRRSRTPLHRDCPIACRRCGATRRRTAPPAGIGVDIGVIIECMVPPFAFRIFGAAIPAIVSAARRG